MTKNSPRRRRFLRGRRRSPFEPGKIKFVMVNKKLWLLFNREKKELDTKLAQIVNLALQWTVKEKILSYVTVSEAWILRASGILSKL